ncbi:hypothetical protein [uncultured Amnibacterium sp.]|uniref:hypothetical protein n=1 Tax=uncultured Amnibacterium sp. TaxID=1631851 RepID=UPI0035CBAB29
MNAWNWGGINQAADTVLIVAGVGVLIVRQFIWRSADPARMLTPPVLIMAAGLVSLVIEVHSGLHWTTADIVVLGELVLVAATGTAMGHVTRFRAHEGQVQYKLTANGVVLWAAFIVIRLASLSLAFLLGATAADTTGLILISFGVNRLAATLVVRRRAAAAATVSIAESRLPADASIG